jgi:hypothetical protein
MGAFLKAVVVTVCLLVSFERVAAACPFCGGKGASGLLENLILVAGVWFGARALARATKRRRLKQRSAEPPD